MWEWFLLGALAGHAVTAIGALTMLRRVYGWTPTSPLTDLRTERLKGTD